MTRWEYRFADVPLPGEEWSRTSEAPAGALVQRLRASQEALLAELGAEGWELVLVRDFPRTDGRFGLVFLFKRPAGSEA